MKLFKHNMGKVDRIIRIILGILLIGNVFYALQTPIGWLGIILMIPWIWFRTHDPFKLIYVIVANALFWVAMIPELRQATAFVSSDTKLDSAKIADLMGMGKMWEVVRKYSIRSLLGRLRSVRRE